MMLNEHGGGQWSCWMDVDGVVLYYNDKMIVQLLMHQCYTGIWEQITFQYAGESFRDGTSFFHKSWKPQT